MRKVKMLNAARRSLAEPKFSPYRWISLKAGRKPHGRAIKSHQHESVLEMARKKDAAIRQRTFQRSQIFDKLSGNLFDELGRTSVYPFRLRPSEKVPDSTLSMNVENASGTHRSPCGKCTHSAVLNRQKTETTPESHVHVLKSKNSPDKWTKVTHLQLPYSTSEGSTGNSADSVYGIEAKVDSVTQYSQEPEQHEGIISSCGTNQEELSEMKTQIPSVSLCEEKVLPIVGEEEHPSHTLNTDCEDDDVDEDENEEYDISNLTRFWLDRARDEASASNDDPDSSL